MPSGLFRVAWRKESALRPASQPFDRQVIGILTAGQRPDEPVHVRNNPGSTPCLPGCLLRISLQQQGRATPSIWTIKMADTSGPAPKVNEHLHTIPDGTDVEWPYRDTHGHGEVEDVHKAANKPGNIEYAIKETDHHPGEPDTVYHYGRVLHRS